MISIFLLSCGLLFATVPQGHPCRTVPGSLARSIQGYFSPLREGSPPRLVSYVVTEIGGEHFLTLTSYGPHTHAVALKDHLRTQALGRGGKPDLQVEVNPETAEIEINYPSTTVSGRVRNFRAKVGSDGVLKLGDLSVRIVALGEAKIETVGGVAVITEINETSGLSDIMQKNSEFKNSAEAAAALLKKAGFATADAKVHRFSLDSNAGNHLAPELDVLLKKGNARHEFNNWMNVVTVNVELALEVPMGSPDWTASLEHLARALKNVPEGSNVSRMEGIISTIESYSKLALVQEISIDELRSTMGRIVASEAVTPEELSLLHDRLFAVAKQLKGRARLVQVEELPSGR